MSELTENHKFCIPYIESKINNFTYTFQLNWKTSPTESQFWLISLIEKADFFKTKKV